MPWYKTDTTLRGMLLLENNQVCTGNCGNAALHHAIVNPFLVTVSISYFKNSQ